MPLYLRSLQQGSEMRLESQGRTKESVDSKLNNLAKLMKMVEN